MQIDFYNLAFETSRVTFYLWSPWRASAIEHRLFEAIRKLAKGEPEEGPDEMRVHVSDPKIWKAAINAAARVLKGWQEEAGLGNGERRSWRWLMEGDADGDGYDHSGDPTTLWCYLRVSLDRGGPGEEEKGEDVDLNGFGIRIWGSTS